MVCSAAIAAVRAELPGHYARLRGGHSPLPPVSDVQVFKAINWWTLLTIREALAELTKNGECIAESTSLGILYRRSPPKEFT